MANKELINPNVLSNYSQNKNPESNEVTKLRNELNSLKKQAYTLPKFEQDKYIQKIEEAKKELRQSQKDIKQKEGVAALAKNVAKLGAAMYGLKAGVDLSKLDIDTPDFTEDKRAASERFGQELGTIEALGKAEQRAAEKQADMRFKERMAEIGSKEKELDRLYKEKGQQAANELKRDLLNIKEAARKRETDEALNRKKQQVFNKAIFELNEASRIENEEDQKAATSKALAPLAGIIDPNELEAIRTKTEKTAWYRIFAPKEEKIERSPEEIRQQIEERRQNKPSSTNEITRILPNGKEAIFDATTKQFIRYK